MNDPVRKLRNAIRQFKLEHGQLPAKAIVSEELMEGLVQRFKETHEALGRQNIPTDFTNLKCYGVPIETTTPESRILDLR